jgi:hypothetical protein
MKTKMNMAVLEEAGDVEVEHPEFESPVLKSVSTLSFVKTVALYSLVTQFVRRWKANRSPSLYWGRSRLPPQRDKQVLDVTYYEFLKLLRQGKEVLIAFYDNENVLHTLRI